VAIRQMVVDPHGAVRRYWWRLLRDEDGFLTDQPVDSTDRLDVISAEEFNRLWRELGQVG
jgi:hypothetical protein